MLTKTDNIGFKSGVAIVILSFTGRMPPNEPMEEKVRTAGKGMDEAWNPNHFGSTTLPWWKNIRGSSVS